MRRGEGEESRSWRRDAAVGVEMKRAKAAAEGRRRSGEEVRRRDDSSLEAPPMAAETWRVEMGSAPPETFGMGGAAGADGRV